MQKRIVFILVTFLAVAVMATGADAKDRKKWGIGVIAGEPTGLTLKYMFDNTMGIDVGAGWSTSSDDEYQIYGDFLYHIYDLLMPGTGQLPLYFGGGLSYLKRDNLDDEFGIRIPVGVEYLFKRVPLAAFAELVPVLNLTPDTDFDMQGGIGIRFQF